MLLFFVLGSTSGYAASYSIYYDSQLSNGSGQPGIWSMDPNGQNQRGFVPGGSEPSWSANGAEMIYLSGFEPHCNDFGSGGTIAMVNSAGGNPKTIGGACGDARISPNGTQVAYASAPDVVAAFSIANASSTTQLVPVPNQTPCDAALAGPPSRQTACAFGTEPSWLGNATVIYSDDTGEGGGLWGLPSPGGSNSPIGYADDQSAGGIDYGISGMSIDPTGTKVGVADQLGSDLGTSLYVVPEGGSTGTEILKAPAGHNYEFPSGRPTRRRSCSRMTTSRPTGTSGSPRSTASRRVAGKSQS